MKLTFVVGAERVTRTGNKTPVTMKLDGETVGQVAVAREAAKPEKDGPGRETRKRRRRERDQ